MKRPLGKSGKPSDLSKLTQVEQWRQVSSDNAYAVHISNCSSQNISAFTKNRIKTTGTGAMSGTQSQENRESMCNYDLRQLQPRAKVKRIDKECSEICKHIQGLKGLQHFKHATVVFKSENDWSKTNGMRSRFSRKISAFYKPKSCLCMGDDPARKKCCTIDGHGYQPGTTILWQNDFYMMKGLCANTRLLDSPSCVLNMCCLPAGGLPMCHHDGSITSNSD